MIRMLLLLACLALSLESQQTNPSLSSQIVGRLTAPIAQGPNGVPVVWNNWIAQGITGVRFFFGVAGGYWSTPYIPNH